LFLLYTYSKLLRIIKHLSFFFSGKISVNVVGDWYYPLDKNSQEDKDAAEAGLKFQVK